MKDEFKKLENNFKAVAEWLTKEYSRINTGRASPSFLDGITVEAYGAFGPIKNVASIVIEDPKTLRIAPWDKNHLKSIEKAIQTSNLGVSTVVDDAGVRVIFPMLTTERRNEYVKLAKKIMEEARITIRKHREDSLSNLKNLGLTEDEMKSGKDSVQKMVDEANNDLEEIFQSKEKEILN